jgi:hypothetical protein
MARLSVRKTKRVEIRDTRDLSMRLRMSWMATHHDARQHAQKEKVYSKP